MFWRIANRNWFIWNFTVISHAFSSERNLGEMNRESASIFILGMKHKPMVRLSSIESDSRLSWRDQTWIKTSILLLENQARKANGNATRIDSILALKQWTIHPQFQQTFLDIHLRWISVDIQLISTSGGYQARYGGYRTGIVSKLTFTNNFAWK